MLGSLYKGCVAVTYCATFVIRQNGEPLAPFNDGK